MESIQMGPAQRPPLAHERRTTGDTQLPVADGIVGGASKQPKGKGIGKKSAKPAPAPAPLPLSPFLLLGLQRPAASHSGPSSATAAADATTAPTARKTAKKNGAPERKKAPSAQTKGGRKDRQCNPRRSPVRCRRPPASNGYAVGSGGQEVKRKGSPLQRKRNAQPPQPTRRAEPKLRPPRSAAVIISLTPSAVAKGCRTNNCLLRFRPEAVVEGCKPNDEDVAKEITGAMPMEVAAEFARPLSLDTDSSESGSTWASTSASRKPSWSVTGYNGKRRGKTQRRSWRTSCNLSSRRSPRISDTEEDRPVLKEDLRKCTQVVRNVVRKSGNLKGTSQKALNWVTDKIVKYVEQPESAVIARLEEEIKKWQEHSARLEANMKAMKEENATLKRRLEDLEASANKSSTEEMLAMVEARVQARLESALMGPAQRPTLAHERRTASGDTQLPVTSGYVGGAPNTKPAKGKGKRKEKGAAQPAPAPAPSPLQSLGPPVRRHNPSRPNPLQSPACCRQPRLTWTRRGSRWSEERKKGKPAAAPTNSTQPPKPTRRKEPKLRPPRSAAVVISLTPAAIAKGLTYKSVLTDAQNKVDLTGLEISKMRPKFAATGAPMYEVPGANSEERADSLAARLRECFAGRKISKSPGPRRPWNCG
ncbi:serine/arginine repetitive matrix protein 1-like [Manduca sexta]|uniref:serine/arginine repetitive matrix protein 1-like n=1 Tax=Manduca sexta TaxID=7130 RepID=UPI00188FDF7A|nr:serine/arginine repetitive matrix protein 1-like [Manduca sexta]